jgi:hypothetical protein
VSIPAPRVLGRTGIFVPAVWRSVGDGAYGGAEWLAVVVGREALDRRGETLVRDRLATLGRAQCDLLIADDIDGGDLKAGWPMHRLGRFREIGLCRFFGLRAHDVLEAEWVVTHTPVHAAVIDYAPAEMSARYRVFAAAALAGVALIGDARTAADFALQTATPEITASLCDASLNAPPLPAADVEALWQQFAAVHAEPPKLKGVHPPEA